MNINMKKVDISIYEMQIKIYQTCDKHFLNKKKIVLLCYFVGKNSKNYIKIDKNPLIAA